MIRHPYGPDELDRRDPALDGIAEQLQAFASGERSGPPVDLAARIHAAVDAAPDPAVGWWTRFTGRMAPWATPARGIAAAAVVAAAVVAALVVGDLADLIRGPIRRARRRARRSSSARARHRPCPPGRRPRRAHPIPLAKRQPSPGDPGAVRHRLTRPKSRRRSPRSRTTAAPAAAAVRNSGPGGGGGGGGDNSGPGGGG